MHKQGVRWGESKGIRPKNRPVILGLGANWKKSEQLKTFLEKGVAQGIRKIVPHGLQVVLKKVVCSFLNYKKIGRGRDVFGQLGVWGVLVGRTGFGVPQLPCGGRPVAPRVPQGGKPIPRGRGVRRTHHHRHTPICCCVCSGHASGFFGKAKPWGKLLFEWL